MNGDSKERLLALPERVRPGEFVRLRLHRTKRQTLRSVRKRYYVDGRRSFGRVATDRWRTRLGLDDEAAIGARRIEVGSGARPTPGYVHVDVDPEAPHLEACAPAWDLPFSDAWADEILASHSLEHVHPRFLLQTLREWHRVLVPGGRVRVLVPNAPQLMKRFLEGPIDEKWSVMGALLGMNCPPDVSTPAQLLCTSQHQILFDPELLRWAFETSGYANVADLTEDAQDVHTEAWASIVPSFSLVFEAYKPPAQAHSPWANGLPLSAAHH
jgi:SAM-dependent methyltransferase